MANYFYGSTQINLNSSGLGYFLIAKDLDFPTYKPSLAAIARQDLWKVTGWQIAERQIQVDIIVVGSSRTDCTARIDTLFQALALRDQNLILHEDGRYWVANATTGKVKFAAGTGIVQAKIPVTFTIADPYPKATGSPSTYDSGNLAYSFNGATYQSSVLSVAGGGTIYTWPQIHLIHKTANQGSTTLTTALVAGTNYTALAVASSPVLVAGQVLTLYWSTGSPLFQLNTQKVAVSSSVGSGATSIPVNAFTAQYNFPASSTTVYVSTAWNTLTIAQLTDNYYLSLTSTTSAPLPQTLGDYLDIYCDPSSGWYISTNGLTPYLDPVGAFPPIEPTTTQWQVLLSADYAPTVDFQLSWTARYLS